MATLASVCQSEICMASTCVTELKNSLCSYFLPLHNVVSEYGFGSFFFLGIYCRHYFLVQHKRGENNSFLVTWKGYP